MLGHPLSGILVKTLNNVLIKIIVHESDYCPIRHNNVSVKINVVENLTFIYSSIIIIVPKLP